MKNLLTVRQSLKKRKTQPHLKLMHLLLMVQRRKTPLPLMHLKLMPLPLMPLLLMPLLLMLLLLMHLQLMLLPLRQLLLPHESIPIQSKLLGKTRLD